MRYFHKSVLQTEAVAGLHVIPSKVYIDATGGGGGHSSLILKQLANSGQLIILDRDPDACEVLLQRFCNNSNVKVVKANFANLIEVLQNLGILEIAGLIMDLGISSYQIDNADRGFCYNKTAYLDMRMEKVGRSAKDIVNTYSVEELTRIFKEYGEEKFAFKIAKHIEDARKNKLIETTSELNAIIEEAVPQFAKKARGHSSKRVFQAIRIEVNRELESLKKGLQDGFKVLMPGGRMSVITFHSLEDRIVKNMFRQFVGGCICPKEFPVCVCGGKITANLVTKHPILPSEEEIKQNKRAKSAKLRILEKC
ncbi:MAG: 16S rRNA (cytosine(1402)-N(4))-methyltransferase RsmH [Oscillospiraceae bacterium]|nr:16S rRNA (cytosine(1402)-N(4))-methyltransferase RsmH [Oscillospiraceae bacterium]